MKRAPRIDWVRTKVPRRDGRGWRDGVVSRRIVVRLIRGYLDSPWLGLLAFG